MAKHIFIFFLFIFNFTITPLGITSAELVGLVVMIAASTDRACTAAVFKYVIQTRFFHISLLLLGLYGVLLSAVWGAHELIFGIIFLKLFFSSIIAYSIVFFLRKDLDHLGITVEKDVIFIFFDVFLVACFLQALTVILSFLDPEIRGVFNDIVANRGNIDINHPFRFRGLHDSGGFNHSVVLGIASIYGFYSAMLLGRRGSLFRLISSVSIAFALTLVGRTGLLICIFGVVFLLFLRPFKFLCAKFIFFVLGSFLIGNIFEKIFPENFEFFNSNIFGYAFEFFINYEQGGGVSTDSSDDLKTMLFIPQGLHFFFGNGSFDVINVGVDRSDSGYVKILLASGVFGFIFFYLQLCGVILWLAQKIDSTGVDRIFFVFLILTFAVTEIKGPVFIQNDTSRFFLLVVMIVFSMKNIRARVNNDKSVKRL